jgi:hypothetical protein
MTILILSIVILALAIGGLAIKLLVKKNGEFSGTCSSNNPMLKTKGGSCGICGAKPDEVCKS